MKVYKIKLNSYEECREESKKTLENVFGVTSIYIGKKKNEDGWEITYRIACEDFQKKYMNTIDKTIQ
jgi:hypothetical protein